jgi:hypothetical protein
VYLLIEYDPPLPLAGDSIYVDIVTGLVTASDGEERETDTVV